MNAITTLNAPNALLASLASSLGIEARFSTEGTQSGSRRVAILCGVTAVNRHAALERTRAAMAPAAADRMDEWLAALHAATKHRGEDTTTLEMILAMYRAVLRNYPADVARQACLGMATQSEWFPTLKELKDRCDALVKDRNALLWALENWRELTATEREGRQLEAKANSLRGERTRMARQLGFVGNIAALSPARRVLFDEVRELDAEIARLDREAVLKSRQPA